MNNSNTNKYKALAAPILVAITLLLLSCGGTVKDPAPGSGQGKVALFITDNISMFKQVVGTVTGVRLLRSGVDTMNCDVLSAPVTLDIANLTDMAQYLDLQACKAGKYNTIEISIKKDVHLMDQLNNASACTLTRIRNMDGSIDRLDCDQDTGICTVGIQGGLRGEWATVQEDRYNDLGIDFNLKEFTVDDFGEHDCSVTMVAATISASDFNESGRAHSVTALIDGLDTTARTFTLLANGASLTVRYSTVKTPQSLSEIDALLQKAQAEGLRVNVRTGAVDLENASMNATEVYLKLAGTVSNLAGNKRSFTLTYGPSRSVLVSVDPSHINPAQDIQGTLANGVWTDVRFGGYSNSNGGTYEAYGVEVLPDGTVLDD
jgi:hypothetical protein